jgi:DNA-nicking Smr family endonuclease
VGADPAAPRAAGIDKATLARLKRGEIAIDARLDLHGLTQAEAHRALDRSLDAAVRGGARLLLVITGRGAGGDGILRRALPGWIASGAHAARVLRLEPAQPRHGGGGAWYVYLRRQRA